jgi:hypothetical protein
MEKLPEEFMLMKIVHLHWRMIFLKNGIGPIAEFKIQITFLARKISLNSEKHLE